jgi:hypothetical protein
VGYVEMGTPKNRAIIERAGQNMMSRSFNIELIAI